MWDKDKGYARKTRRTKDRNWRNKDRKDWFRVHQSPRVAYSNADPAVGYTSYIRSISSLSLRLLPTTMFPGIPPWERRVNKHLSFVAREATGRLKCLNLGAWALVPLRPFASFSSPFLTQTAGRMVARRKTRGYELWRLGCWILEMDGSVAELNGNGSVRPERISLAYTWCRCPFELSVLFPFIHSMQMCINPSSSSQFWLEMSL